MKKKDPYEKLIEIAKKKRIFRIRDIQEQGIHPEYVRRLLANGELERISRGIYMLSGTEIDEYQSYVEVCKRVPDGVICLLSALKFHDIGTQNPHEVWIAIDRKARKPVFEYPPVRIVRFSGSALREGIAIKNVGGVEIKVFNVSKTVVDCFKYRNKIGIDIAIEALHDCRRNKRCSAAEIGHYAKICRVFNVMRPYMESIE